MVEVVEPVTLLMVQGVGGLAPVSKSAFWRTAPAGQGFGSEVDGLGGFLRVRYQSQSYVKKPNGNKYNARDT
jgi:hypothetical protein